MLPGETQLNQLRMIDLFAGIGGFRLAFERAGARCVFSSEWDRFARETYCANFQDTPAGDLRAISTEEIPPFDLLCAGFPCQAFSIAGVSKKNALGRAHGFLDKTQGTLFFEVARVIRDRSPDAFVLENVKNLLHHDRGETFRVIMRVLSEELGYTIHHRIINARTVVPQNRARVFIVGFKSKEIAERYQWPEFPERPAPRLGDILESRVHSRYRLSDRLWNYLQDYRDRHARAGNGFGFGLVDRDGIARTLSARYYKDGSEILVPVRGRNPRRLTPRECARLMGYPDDFKIVVSDTQAYKQFGNSVVVPVVERVAMQIVGAMKGRTPKRVARPLIAEDRRRKHAARRSA